MACRVGITTDPQRRKETWRQKCKNFRDWEIEGGPMAREEAQAMEDQIAKSRGCESAGGGDDPDVPSGWYVYSFNHDGCS